MAVDFFGQNCLVNEQKACHRLFCLSSLNRISAHFYSNVEIKQRLEAVTIEYIQK